MAYEYLYGPSRGSADSGQTGRRTPAHLHGYALKILGDFERQARLYDGVRITLIRAGDSTRCPVCTDEITGAKLFSSCVECGGSGKLTAWTLEGSFWARLQVQPGVKTTSEAGLHDAAGNRDMLILYGAPEILPDDLLRDEELNMLYKVVEAGPDLIMMRGVVLSQVVQAHRLSSGAFEYAATEAL